MLVVVALPLLAQFVLLNVQRSDLNAIEEAGGYRSLVSGSAIRGKSWRKLSSRAGATWEHDAASGISGQHAQVLVRDGSLDPGACARVDRARRCRSGRPGRREKGPERPRRSSARHRAESLRVKTRRADGCASEEDADIPDRGKRDQRRRRTCGSHRSQRSARRNPHSLQRRWISLTSFIGRCWRTGKFERLGYPLLCEGQLSHPYGDNLIQASDASPALAIRRMKFAVRLQEQPSRRVSFRTTFSSSKKRRTACADHPRTCAARVLAACEHGRSQLFDGLHQGRARVHCCARAYRRSRLEEDQRKSGVTLLDAIENLESRCCFRPSPSRAALMISASQPSY